MSPDCPAEPAPGPFAVGAAPFGACIERDRSFLAGFLLSFLATFLVAFCGLDGFAFCTFFGVFFFSAFGAFFFLFLGMGKFYHCLLAGLNEGP